MKLPKTAAASFAFAPIFAWLALLPIPNVAQKPLFEPNNPNVPPFLSNRHLLSPESIAQAPTPTPSNLGKELLQQVLQCVASQSSNPQQASTEALQAATMQCFYKVVMLAPDGTIRPDASQRLKALIKATGITVPHPVSQGQASVQLQPLADSQVLTIPVTIGGKRKTFLFDTGATNSIVDSQTAQQLNLSGTPVPNEMLKYMAVGDNCSNLKATMYSLPALTVDSATVEGIYGLGLSKTAIPGKLSGVLGLDFLSGFDIVLNPQTRQLQLLRPSKSSVSGIPLQGKLGVMTAQVKINGQGPFTFMLDTGADVSVVSARLASRLSLKSTNKATDVQGFCGTQASKQTKLAQVNLQQYQAKNLNAVILDSDVLKLLGVDGIIGQNFLNRYQQHWRFGDRDELGLPDRGSLSLTALQRKTKH